MATFGGYGLPLLKCSVISDGDSKTHENFQSLKIYGEGIEIDKQECVNNVAKRLCTGLRNLK